VPTLRMVRLNTSFTAATAHTATRTGTRAPYTHMPSLHSQIQNLEHDDLFRGYISHPLFEQACRRSYGAESVSAFRIMFFNKPAGRGTNLPWHQDRWHHLDRDPLLTVCTFMRCPSS
jgi:hypothetical protein